MPARLEITFTMTGLGAFVLLASSRGGGGDPSNCGARQIAQLGGL